MTDADIVICGGGMAGLLLARQLQLHQPERSIAILDKAGTPSPASCHKVGESLTEGPAYHLRHTAGLEDYMAAAHLPKFGLRFFFGGGGRPFDQRLEYGGTQWPTLGTFQVDRGIFENDLRAMVVARGARIVDRCRIEDIAVADRAGAHRVTAIRDGRPLELSGRWVIDATGRRRMLATKLGLRRAVDHPVSACWWRVDGRVDVEALVDARSAPWHRRVGPPRWYSTNHITGAGYWIWIIPLVCDRTSIGIVSDEAAHPVSRRACHDDALAWCRTHEPELAGLLADRPALDFHALKHYAHATQQAFSLDRWACLGDAAVFADPLYSSGQDLIAHAVSMTAQLIRLDFAGRLTAEAVAASNALLFTVFDIILEQSLGACTVLGSPFLYTQKLAWDSTMYFAVLQQLLLQNVHELLDDLRPIVAILERLAALNRRMQALFRTALRRDGRLDVYAGMRTWAQRATRYADDAVEKVRPAELAAMLARNLGQLEDTAVALFSSIVEHSPSIASADRRRLAGAGIRPDAIGLPPERWDADGLFKASQPRVDLGVRLERRSREDQDDQGDQGDREAVEWGVEDKRAAERRAFRPVHDQLCDTAARHGERTAVASGGAALTYRELVARAADRWRQVRALGGPLVAIDAAAPDDALLDMLAALRAGKAFALLDGGWTVDQRRLISDRRPRGAVPGDPSEIAAETLAFTDARFTAHGPRIVDVDHGAWCRATRWLIGLIARGLPEHRAMSAMTCAWLGAARPELLAPLVAGHRVACIAPRAADGGAPRTELAASGAEVVLSRPADLRRLVDAGWSAAGCTVVAVGEALDHALSMRLRSQAARVIDFGYPAIHR